ncbi:methylthioribulose-1-phosphate dehydratase [Monosporozyma unispora]|nr:Methylthioribulose-1-phosphate dehydratase [Kazachstania unispora]
MYSIQSHDPRHPANLICSLSNQFFHKEWCLGTGGAMSIEDETSNCIYVTPSGVQKELMKPKDLYVLTKGKEKNQYDPVYTPPLKISDCSPLFLACHEHKQAKAVIHTHSQNAVLITLLYDKEFNISNMEQIKAMPSGAVDSTTGKQINLSFHDNLCIPIIDNKPHEHDLLESLEKVFNEYPNACAVLVRRHGLFVWGPTVDKAKIYNESIDYLLGLAIKMDQLNIPM